MADLAGREAVAAVWRIESARTIGALTRYAGDLALAEDLAQDGNERERAVLERKLADLG